VAWSNESQKRGGWRFVELREDARAQIRALAEDESEPEAASAVRQWRYQPTLLSDQPIETAQDVTIVFRLSRSAASAN
jgi:hypothetical protein